MEFPFDIRPENTLWEMLSRESRPIVLYGTGNGGDKIIDQLARIGKTPDGVFASTGFVRNRTFRGMPVESYEDLTARLGSDIVILIAFGSALPSVMEQMEALTRRHTVFVPEVPLFGGEVFTYEYYEQHREKLADAYSLLSDDTSRALFLDALSFRLTGAWSALARTESFSASLTSLLATEKIHTVLDGGAFTGDTAALFLHTFPEITSLIAVEADARSYKKLSAFAETTDGTVLPVHTALWDREDTLTYSASASRGAGAEGQNRRSRTVSVPANTVDRLAAGTPLDLVKLDVEGAEARALAGGLKTIRRDRPALLVSLYHRTEDLFALPLWLAGRTEGYRFYLRRVPSVPMWDLLLYALPERLCQNTQNP